MNRQTPHQLIHSADATQEYRGPVVEVLTDVSVELLPDESVDVRSIPSPASPAMIAQSMRRTTLSPVAVDANASMEFPHPVAPELFADGTGELFPDLDETLPPAPRHTAPRFGYAAFTSVMVVAAIVIGLAIGSRARPVSISSATTVGAEETPKAQTIVIERKPIARPDPAANAALSPAATVGSKPAEPSTGVIASPKWAKGRRVFLDDKDIGLSGKLDAACGQHVVKIGAGGKARKVTVPCGGQITVLP